ncbi:S1 family peptidase [Thiothrix nivea]|uniref:S1 family peptidase n=1 Tax=Thiothrix nivea TaxID=1031 RepID=UPI0002DADF1C|nr:serine protease [Thiothrix nivea]
MTCASGFYFQRNQNLFLITNRHVVRDEDSGHEPDRLEITLHTNPDNVAETSAYSIPLYDNAGQMLWREAKDNAGTVDVVAIPIDSRAFPADAMFAAFKPTDLPGDLENIEVGESIRVVGFPLNFQDSLHNLPVMRHAIIASAFSLRFQGYGYFLTDSLLHRGSSGSPVVLRVNRRVSGRDHFPWMLLGIHSSRLDSVNQEEGEDERLNLFTAWYSDVIMTLTNHQPLP